MRYYIVLDPVPKVNPVHAWYNMNNVDQSSNLAAAK